MYIWDVLRDLVPFVQTKKREKSIEECYFNEIAALLNVSLLHGCF